MTRNRISRTIAAVSFLAGASVIAAATYFAPATESDPPPPQIAPATHLPYAATTSIEPVAATTLRLSCVPALEQAGADDLAGDDFAAAAATQYGLTAATLPRTFAESDAEEGNSDEKGSAIGSEPLSAPGRVSLMNTGDDAAFADITGSGTDAFFSNDPALLAGSYLEFAPVEWKQQADSEASQAVALAGATGLQLTRGGDWRGLTATTCTPPAVNHWFVGPDTNIGTTTTLMLMNPGQTTATVSVRMWGEIGEISVPGTVVIGPGQTDSILLGAVSMESRTAVEVTSEGGPISAMIYHHVLDGVSAQGVAALGAGAPPALTQWLSAIPTGQGQAELVVANPGDAAAVVDVTLITTGGSEPLGGAQQVDVDPGTVLTIPLGGISHPYASVRVDASEPVVASAQVVVAGDPNPLDPGTDLADRAWVPGQVGIVGQARVDSQTGVDGQAGEDSQVGAGSQVIVMPRGQFATAALALTNTAAQAQDVLVAIHKPNGQVHQVPVEIPAHTLYLIDQSQLDPGSAITITGEGIVASGWLEIADELGPLVTSVLPLADQQRSQEVAVTLIAP